MEGHNALSMVVFFSNNYYAFFLTVGKVTYKHRVYFIFTTPNILREINFQNPHQLLFRHR